VLRELWNGSQHVSCDTTFVGALTRSLTRSRHTEMFGRDAPKTSDVHGSCSEHELACARVEDLEEFDDRLQDLWMERWELAYTLEILEQHLEEQ